MAPEAEQLRLLVVDDEPKLTEFLRMELEVEGYAVQVVHDGASGLIALRGEPAPDLVLLDWNLPDFTGLDICRRIRATGMTVPVLMLTGYDEVKDKVEALDAGVDDYLVKPFLPRELTARTEAVLRPRNGMPTGFDWAQAIETDASKSIRKPAEQINQQ